MSDLDLDDSLDDYLDVQGRVGVNYLNGRPWSASYRDVAQRTWARLPMYVNKEKLRQIIQTISAHQVTILTSGTGSGKTVIMPKIAAKYVSLVHKGGLAPAKKVAVTNPKATTTHSNAEYGAMTADVTLGREVGELFRGSSAATYSKEVTRILYLTDGYLLNLARNDPLFSEYAVLILDEAHERPVPTDFLMLAIRRALVGGQRPDLRVVIMSATIDTSPFVKYFTVDGQEKVGIVSVSGTPNYPVTSLFMPKSLSTKGYLAAGLQAVNNLVISADNKAHKATFFGLGEVEADASACSPSEEKPAASPPQRSQRAPGDGHILFFVPTSKDAAQGCKLFDSTCRQDKKCDVAVACRPLYSKLSQSEQRLAVDNVVAPIERKIVFATNIAESSLTIRNLDVVIDSGLQLTSAWDAATCGQVIKKQFTSRAQIRQRLGRVGRQRPGTALHLYTKEDFCKLPEYPDPTILTIDVTDELMNMLRSKGHDQHGSSSSTSSLTACIQDFHTLLTPPHAVQVLSAISILHFYRVVNVWEEKEEEDATSKSTKTTKSQEVNASQQESQELHPQPSKHFMEMDYNKRMTINATYESMAKMRGSFSKFGQLVSSLMLVFRVSFVNALLLATGIVYECEADCVAIVALFETCAGDIAMLFTGGGGKKHAEEARDDDDAYDVKEVLKELARLLGKTSKVVTEARGGDYAMLAYLLRYAFPKINKMMSPRDEGQQQTLNMTIWSKAYTLMTTMTARLKSFKVHQLYALKAECPLLNMRAMQAKHADDRAGAALVDKDPLTCALIAARLYNVASSASSSLPFLPVMKKTSSKDSDKKIAQGGERGPAVFTTLMPARKVPCQLEYTISEQPHRMPQLILYEHLHVSSASSNRISTLLCLPQLPAWLVV